MQRGVSHTMETVIRVKIISSSTLPMCHLDAGSLVATYRCCIGGAVLYLMRVQLRRGGGVCVGGYEAIEALHTLDGRLHSDVCRLA
jgi:hypothetical protein